MVILPVKKLKFVVVFQIVSLKLPMKFFFVRLSWKIRYVVA